MSYLITPSYCSLKVDFLTPYDLNAGGVSCYERQRLLRQTSAPLQEAHRSHYTVDLLITLKPLSLRSTEGETGLLRFSYTMPQMHNMWAEIRSIT
jgi:hypothetical protein